MTQNVGNVRRAFYEYLVNASGSPDMHIDGSGTPVAFVFRAPRALDIHRVNFVAEAAAKEDLNGFFSLAELDNGLTIIHRKSEAAGGGTLQNFGTGVVPITTHTRLGALAGVDVASDSVANKSRFDIRWTLRKSGVPLAMQHHEEFIINVRDNLSTLLYFHVMVQGV